MKRLPPLKSLQAFEAAGRHLSFTEAAHELNVTPGAISQQIRALEEFLEIKEFLLHRVPQARIRVGDPLEESPLIILR